MHAVTAAEPITAGSQSAAAYPIRRVAVLGAGTMGSRIAAHFANAGFPVLLLDMAQPGEPNALAARALDALKKSKPAALAAPASAPEAAVTPSILPPSTGTTVSTSRPYATPVEPEGADVDDAGIIEGTADAPAPTEFSTASGTNGSSPEPVSLPMTESVSMAEIESGVPGNHHG